MLATIRHQEPPPLAVYKRISEYTPEIGDFVIRTKFLSVQYGIVAGVSTISGATVVDIVFEGLPVMLFSMVASDQPKYTKRISLDYITTSSPGAWSIMHHDKHHNTPVWYI